MTQGSKGLGRNQRNLYNFFLKYPNKWLSIGGDVVTQRILNDLISRKLVRKNEFGQCTLVTDDESPLEESPENEQTNDFQGVG